MISIYRIITFIFSFFAPVYLKYRLFKKKEHITKYKEKISVITTIRGNGNLVWFHAASIGELKSIIPLVEILNDNIKVKKILLTTITKSSIKIVEKNFKHLKKINHQFLPFDVNKYIKSFLDHWSPNLAIFVESEIWPNLILNLKKRKIPTFLINGRISKKTFLRWSLFLKSAKKIFGNFDLCIAQNKQSELHLLKLGAKKINNYGNLKFASSKNEILNKQKNEILIDKRTFVWSAVSTHHNEEIFCTKVHELLKKKINNVLTIIIPRHIERIPRIIGDIDKLNLKIKMYSKTSEINDDTDIYLIDAYGETEKFLNISKSVFMGGSLIEHGGQNPIEAAKRNCRVYHGPNINNFNETYEILNKMGITKKILNVDELVENLSNDINQNITKKNKNEEINIYGNNILKNITKDIEKIFENEII